MAVFEGIWYNHATDRLIWTLSPAAAGFLTAAIVTFVQIVAAATWPICRFLLYIIRQGGSSGDVFHHQRQILLRNSSGPAGAAGELFNMAWEWRSYRVQSFLRVFAYLLVSLAIFVGWTVCGLYAPFIYTQTSSDVLLAQSAYCGWPQPVTTPDNGQLAIFDMYSANIVNQMAASNIYVQQCYGDTSSSAACNNYPRQSFEFTTSNGTCPFGNEGEVCLSINSTTLVFDTGYLDSNRDFGINAKPDDTVQYRRVSTCSPIHLTGFVKEINTTRASLASFYPPDEILFQYMYGPADSLNYTFQYAWYQADYPIAYTLDSRHYIAGFSNSYDSYVPNITVFNSEQHTGDLSMLFLAGNNVKYVQPLYDPWFAAGLDKYDVVVIPHDATTNFTVYTTTHAVSPVACQEQHQICIAGSESNCTPLTGISSLLNETQYLQGLRDPHIAAAGILEYTTTMTSMADVVSVLGSSALLASRTLNGVLQTSILAPDQWRLEMANLFSIGLARMQALTLSYAMGPTNPAFNQYVEPPLEVMQKYACRTQRVRDPQGTSNFDMSGLIVLVATGAFLIALGLSFESLLGLLSKHSARMSASRAKWLSEGLFHLHKATLEARGVTDWQKTKSTMPRSKQRVDPDEMQLQLNVPEDTVVLLDRGKK